MGLTSPSLTGSAGRSRSATEHASRPVDEVLLDGHLQGTEQILNIRYSPGNVGPVTRETMSKGSIRRMRLSGGYCRQVHDLFNPLHSLLETYSSMLAPSAARFPLMVIFTSMSAKSAFALVLCSSFTIMG